MDVLSSDFNLRMLNLMIGLCRGAAGLPADLRQLGYQDQGIEFPFRNSDDQRVVPELVMASEQIGHCVLCEWKSGNNVQPGQLARYGRVTQDDLREKAFLPVAAIRHHDTAVFGREESVGRLALGLQEAGCAFPLLGVADDGIALRQNEFACPEANTVFRPRLDVDMASVPMGFVPFDGQSPHWLVAQYCCNQIICYMTARRPVVQVDELCRDTCSVWGMLGDVARRDLRRRVQVLLTTIAQAEFRNYLRRNRGLASRTHTATWDITNNPLDLATDRRSGAWRLLQRQAERFVQSLREGDRQLGLDMN